VGHQPHADVIEAALARALEGATHACQLSLVAGLARQLEDRKRERERLADAPAAPVLGSIVTASGGSAEAYSRDS